MASSADQSEAQTQPHIPRHHSEAPASPTFPWSTEHSGDNTLVENQKSRQGSGKSTKWGEWEPDMKGQEGARPGGHAGNLPEPGEGKITAEDILETLGDLEVDRILANARSVHAQA